MKCDADCERGEQAAVFFSFIEGDKIKKVNLCKHCAQERKVSDPTGYSLIDLLQGMGEESKIVNRRTMSDELTCEFCGFTQSDFKKTGRFGCARCYGVFSEGLENLLEAMHKNTEHHGKVPSDFSVDPNLIEPSAISPGPAGSKGGLDLDLFALGGSDEIDPEFSGPQSNIAILEDKLEVAISAEDYEEAARIRDQISKLKGSDE